VDDFLATRRHGIMGGDAGLSRYQALFNLPEFIL
jgi:hypothetical protein